MPDEPTFKDRATAEAARASAEAAAKLAAEAVGKAAHEALDALENLLFGKVGGAEEQLRKDAAATPLDRLRAELGPPEERAVTPKPDPVEEARRQLEELKRQREAEPTPMK